MARGTFGTEGGVLEGPGGVTLIIPPGALPPNSHQEIYFSVTDDSNTRGHRSSISPPMHNGERLAIRSWWWFYSIKLITFYIIFMH